MALAEPPHANVGPLLHSPAQAAGETLSLPWYRSEDADAKESDEGWTDVGAAVAVRYIVTATKRWEEWRQP